MMRMMCNFCIVNLITVIQRAICGYETQESIISTEDELDDKCIEDTMEEMLEAVEKDLEQNDDESQT